MKQILVINPNTSEAMTSSIEETAKRVCSKETVITAVNSPMGPESIESASDHCLSAPGVLHRVIEGAGKYDGFVVACFDDPAIDAAREVAGVPVVGIGEASLLTACLLGREFSILVALQEAKPLIGEVVARCGLVGRCASIRATGLSVLEVHSDPDMAMRRLAEEGRLAMEVDGASVLCLGCAGMTGIREELQRLLSVPVIDGVEVAVRMVEHLVDSGLAPKRDSWDKKILKGYGKAFASFYRTIGDE